MNGVNDHGKLVDGRVDSSPSRDTLLLLPSGISVSGIESWVRKLADVASGRGGPESRKSLKCPPAVDWFWPKRYY